MLLDVRPDTADFRDRMYSPALVEVPPEVPLSQYLQHAIPILNQGYEGACTGFALATVAHFLLRTRKASPDDTIVSARMFYELAKRYDSFAGEDYDGSTARGAVKAWHKHGVCPLAEWPNFAPTPDRALTLERARSALKFPLGAYYRVDSKDIVAMHAALAEVGILYATAAVHNGWRAVQSDGKVPQGTEMIGGHAFAIVGYDADGFWFQNSWGDAWGCGGFGHISYDDWLANGHDCWVLRLGAEVHSKGVLLHDGAPQLVPLAVGTTFCELRPHVISVCNNGQPCFSGMFANDDDTIASVFNEHFQSITKDWKTKRILFYAHGGLVSEDAAIARLQAWRQALLERHIYPIFFIWNTDIFSTVKSVLEDALSQPQFMPESNPLPGRTPVLDDMIEPFARAIGRPYWEEMKENAFQSATSSSGAAVIAARHAMRLTLSEDVEFHFVGHSAGSIFLSLLLQIFCSEGIIQSGPLSGRIGFNVRAETLTLWAPACTIKLFSEVLLPLLKEDRISKFALFTLDDFSEQSDSCLRLYRKSFIPSLKCLGGQASRALANFAGNTIARNAEIYSTRYFTA
jgi:hypothetical protein